MNKYLKEFLKRGFAFSGLGPVIAAIVIFIISHFENNFYLSASQLLIAVISTYFLAFIQAGASVFNQIEHWSIAKALACHFSSLYTAYLICYLVNSWIPFDITVVIVFSVIFAVTFLVIWTAVFFTVKILSRKLNQKIQKIV